MSGDLRPGDRVEWNAHGGRNTTGGKAEGVVEEEYTSDVKHGGRTYRASEDDPRYRVKSEKSGRSAIHKGSALQKKKKK